MLFVYVKILLILVNSGKDHNAVPFLEKPIIKIITQQQKAVQVRAVLYAYKSYYFTWDAFTGIRTYTNTTTYLIIPYVRYIHTERS